MVIIEIITSIGRFPKENNTHTVIDSTLFTLFLNLSV